MAIKVALQLANGIDLVFNDTDSCAKSAAAPALFRTILNDHHQAAALAQTEFWEGSFSCSLKQQTGSSTMPACGGKEDLSALQNPSRHIPFGVQSHLHCSSCPPWHHLK
ncbi:hypothetical protein QQF64_012138 [Cirrhinus molitorella]|uniref:Uncharacterized protein n=1 Tax=Cirrhinus molitorella TaxID=172907 RepID=A0ABR3LYQ1_9TELE